MVFKFLPKISVRRKKKGATCSCQVNRRSAPKPKGAHSSGPVMSDVILIIERRARAVGLRDFACPCIFDDAAAATKNIRYSPGAPFFMPAYLLLQCIYSATVQRMNLLLFAFYCFMLFGFTTRLLNATAPTLDVDFLFFFFLFNLWCAHRMIAFVCCTCTCPTGNISSSSPFENTRVYFPFLFQSVK